MQGSECNTNQPGNVGTGKIPMNTMSIKSELGEVTRLSEWLRQLLTNETFEVKLASQVELLMVEAVNNVIEHGYGGSPGNDITVSVDFQSDRVSLNIIDSGQPPPSSKSYQNAILPDALTLPESGWGLGLINIIADHVQVHSNQGVNTTQLTKLIVGQCTTTED